MLLGGEDARQVVAERFVDRGEGSEEQAELDEPGRRVSHFSPSAGKVRRGASEFLRPDQRDEEVDEEAECQQAADDVGQGSGAAHSFSKPRNTSASTTKTPISSTA
ncbi:hypothetical protein GCM10017567_30310 [Amycolatopsis bullii]|uniref:Uncharacterized protein n=1 Tax=Amycolatopsis bullii TaxID=941987 RepID=A0ABQ3KDD3_9PSEU|nr:hypothetical protein GCM10017567_30310 [Amycolatopsis bullii]